MLRHLLLVSSALLITPFVHAQSANGRLSTGVSSAKGEPSSPWSASFFSLGSAPQQAVEKGGPSVYTYNYIGLNYKVSKARKFSVRPVFQYTTSGKDKFGEEVESAMTPGDAHLVYADNEMGTIGAAKVSTNFKLYFPTSESSQASGMFLKFRPESVVALDVNTRDSVAYVMKPDFYIQSRASNFDSSGREKTTPVFVLEHSLEYGAGLSKDLTLTPSVGFVDSFYNPSKNPKITSHKTEAKLALSLSVRATKALGLTFCAENKFAVTDRKNEVSFFNPEENSLVLMVNASL